MGKKLAIWGHATRDKEVIELLEMMGGSNIHNLSGNDIFSYYIIKGFKNEIREELYIFGNENIYYFTLEEFLEKYPFKLNDKVIDKADGCPGVVCEMKWDVDVSDMKYCVAFGNGIDFGWFVNDSIEFCKENENLEEKQVNPIMKQKELKDYLKPGYIVEYDGGSRFVITQDVHGNNFGLQLGTAIMWASLDTLDSIVKVYQIDRPGALHKTFDQDTHLTLVWEKPKKVELTMQEIANRLGIDVKQLRIKE